MTYPRYYMHRNKAEYYKINDSEGTGMTINFRGESISSGFCPDRKNILRYSDTELALHHNIDKIEDKYFIEIYNEVKDQINKQLIKL